MKHAILSLCLLLAAPMALAETPQDRLVSALVAEGYTILQSERTWLGRLRVIAIKGDLRREVVINPGTGEVLRDFAVAEDPAAGADDGAGPAATAVTTPGVAVSDGTTSTASGTPDGLDAAGSAGESGSVIGDFLLPESAVSQ